MIVFIGTSVRTVVPMPHEGVACCGTPSSSSFENVKLGEGINGSDIGDQMAFLEGVAMATECMKNQGNGTIFS